MSFTTQYAMPREFGGKWGWLHAECFNTIFSGYHSPNMYGVQSELKKTRTILLIKNKVTTLYLFPKPIIICRDTQIGEIFRQVNILISQPLCQIKSI